jgi:hypothetical protein
MRKPENEAVEVNLANQHITMPFRKFCNEFLSKFTLPPEIKSTIQKLNNQRQFFKTLKTRFDSPPDQTDFSEEEKQFLVRSSQIDPKNYQKSEEPVEVSEDFNSWLQVTKKQISAEHLAYAEMEIESQIIGDISEFRSISIKEPKDLDLARLYKARSECTQHHDIGQVIIAKYLTENIFDQIRTNITFAWFHSLSEAHQTQILQIYASHELMEQASNQKMTIDSLKGPINGFKPTRQYQEDINSLAKNALSRLPEASATTMDSLRAVIEEWSQQETNQFQAFKELESIVSGIEQDQQDLTRLITNVLTQLEQSNELIQPEIYQALQRTFTQIQDSERTELAKLLTQTITNLNQQVQDQKIKSYITRCEQWNSNHSSIEEILNDLKAIPDGTPEIITDLKQTLVSLKKTKIKSIQDVITSKIGLVNNQLSKSLLERINSWSERQSSEEASQRFLDRQIDLLLKTEDLKFSALSRLQKEIFAYPTPLMWLDDQIEPSLAASLKSKKDLKDDQRSKDFRKDLSGTVSTLEFTSIFPELTDVNSVVFEALFSLYNEFIRLETKSKLDNGIKLGDLKRTDIFTKAEKKLYGIIEAKQVLSISGKETQPAAIFRNLVTKPAFTGSLALTIATSKLRDIPFEATISLVPNQEKLQDAIQRTNKTIDQYKQEKALKESALEKAIQDFAAPTIMVREPTEKSGSEGLEAKSREKPDGVTIERLDGLKTSDQSAEQSASSLKTQEGQHKRPPLGFLTAIQSRGNQSDHSQQSEKKAEDVTEEQRASFPQDQKKSEAEQNRPPNPLIANGLLAAIRSKKKEEDVTEEQSASSNQSQEVQHRPTNPLIANGLLASIQNRGKLGATSEQRKKSAAKVPEQKDEELEAPKVPVISSLDDITESDIVLCFAFLNDLLGNDELASLYSKDKLSADSLIGQFQQFWSLSGDERHSKFFNDYNRYANAIKFSDKDNREIFEHVYSQLLSSIPEDTAEIRLKALVQTFNKFIIFYLDQANKHFKDERPALTATLRSIQAQRVCFLSAKSSSILDREDHFFDQLHINNLFHVLTSGPDTIMQGISSSEDFPEGLPILLDFPPKRKPDGRISKVQYKFDQFDDKKAVRADEKSQVRALAIAEILKFKDYADSKSIEVPILIKSLEELFLCDNFTRLDKTNIFTQSSDPDDVQLIQEIKHLNNFLRDFFIAQLKLDSETQEKVFEFIAAIDRTRNQIELSDQAQTDKIKTIILSLKDSLSTIPPDTVSKIIYLIEHLDNKKALLTSMQEEISLIQANIARECEVISDLQERTKRCHKYPNHAFKDIAAATSEELLKPMPFTESSKSPEIQKYEELRNQQQKAFLELQKAETNFKTIESRIEEDARPKLSELFILIDDLCRQQIKITYNEASEEERELIITKTINGLWSKIRNYLFDPALNDAANTEFKTRLAYFTELKQQLDTYITEIEARNHTHKGTLGEQIKQQVITAQERADLEAERDVLGINDKLVKLNQLLLNIDDSFGDLGEAILSKVSDIQKYAKQHEQIASFQRQNQLLHQEIVDITSASAAREAELMQRIAELEAIQKTVDTHRTPTKTPTSAPRFPSPQKALLNRHTPFNSSKERATASRDFTAAARSLVTQVLEKIQRRITDEQTMNRLIGELSTKLQKQPQQNIDEIMGIFQQIIPTVFNQASHLKDNAKKCIQDFFAQQQDLLEGNELYQRQVTVSTTACQTHDDDFRKAAHIPAHIKPIQRRQRQAQSEILTYIRERPESEQLKYCHFVAKAIYYLIDDKQPYKRDFIDLYKLTFNEEFLNLKLAKAKQGKWILSLTRDEKILLQTIEAYLGKAAKASPGLTLMSSLGQDFYNFNSFYLDFVNNISEYNSKLSSRSSSFSLAPQEYIDFARTLSDCGDRLEKHTGKAAQRSADSQSKSASYSITLARTNSQTSLSSDGSDGSRRNLSSEFVTSASSSQGDEKLTSDYLQKDKVITDSKWKSAAEDVSRFGGR